MLTATLGSAAVAIGSSVRVTAPEVATAVSARTGTLVADCAPHGKCVSPPLRQVIVSFVSRAALPSGSWYYITLDYVPRGSCYLDQGGQGARVNGPLRAGEWASQTFRVPNCPRIIDGAVAYNGPNTVPHKPQYAPGVGSVDGLLVGTFTLSMS
jgi:hypothetical protein